MAVAVEALSDHPLAEAIVRDSKEKLGLQAVPPASELNNLTGRGVTAKLDGQTVWIGKAEMFGAGVALNLNRYIAIQTALAAALKKQKRGAPPKRLNQGPTG